MHTYTLETRRDVLALFPTIAHTKAVEGLLGGNIESDTLHETLTPETPGYYLYNYVHAVGSLVSPSTSQI